MDAKTLLPFSTQTLHDFPILTPQTPYCNPTLLSQDLTHSKRYKNHLLFQGTFDILEEGEKKAILVLVVKGPTGKWFPSSPKF